MRQTAIIREVGYGCRDTGTPCLWFTAYIDESSAALQILHQPRADKVIADARVKDVHDLDGKPCWVEVGTGTICFEEMWSK